MTSPLTPPTSRLPPNPTLLTHTHRQEQLDKVDAAMRTFATAMRRLTAQRSELHRHLAGALELLQARRGPWWGLGAKRLQACGGRTGG